MVKVEDVSTAEARVKKLGFIIKPTSIAYQCWEALVATSSLFLTLAVTFQLSFKSNVPGLSPVTYFFDFVYFIHIILKFHVAFIKDGGLIVDSKLIKRKYARGEFIIDVLSLLHLPLVLAAEFVGYTSGYASLRILRLVGIGKLNRILRFYTLTKFFGKNFSYK